MKLNTHLIGVAGIAVAVSMALSACDRERDVSPQVATSTDTPAQDSTVAPGTSALGQDPALARNDAPNTMLGNEPTGAGTPHSTAPTPASAMLGAQERQFLTEASAGGQYEMAVAQMATEKAADASVRSYATMLVSDHTAANQRLQQIAQRHNIVLPSTLPADKQSVIDELSKATGAEFDRQFVNVVGLSDHKHDISLFEKASREAKDPEIREFASSTLPTLRAHLSAAQNLPSTVKGKTGSAS